ncbi:MAG: cysteine hydrolase [Acidimicrobiales bacterium]|nr:cysteine hydrolase [Acidimicrobiales bacterium]
MTIHVAGTDPYAWPYDGRLDGRELALVLAGWDEGWAGRVTDRSPAHAGCLALAAAVAAFGGLVIGVHHAGSAPLDLPGTHLAVAAHGIDGFHGGPLDDILRSRGRTHLLVGGMGLEAPVHSTLRAANDRGYEALLVADASAPLRDDLREASLKTVTMSGGIFGAVGQTEAVLTALTSAPATAPGQEATTP